MTTATAPAVANFVFIKYSEERHSRTDGKACFGGTLSVVDVLVSQACQAGHISYSPCDRIHKIDFYSREGILLFKLRKDFFILEIMAGISLFEESQFPFYC